MAGRLETVTKLYARNQLIVGPTSQLPTILAEVAKPFLELRPWNNFLHAMLVDKMPDAELPQWLGKADVRTVGVLTLDDGEQMTAEVVEFDEERSELVVDVISPNRPPSERQAGRSRHPGQPHCLLRAPTAHSATVAILRSLPG